MTRRTIPFASLAIAGALLGPSGARGLEPTYLRCEYLVNPLGIDVPKPRLSWVLESDRRGAAQTAYQVLVASTFDKLWEDQGDLWDSGKVESDRSAQVEYGGPALPSRAECHWKVRVWDEGGKPSPWSGAGFWTVGLLAPSDWTAEWIGCEVPEDLASETYLPAPSFRKDFEVSGEVRAAYLHATAAGLYELHMNGKRVGEDLLAPGWTEYSKRIWCRTYDVTDLLEPGKNAIGAILGDGWYGLHHGGRGKLRLRAQLEVERTDGTRQTVGTDGSWRATWKGPILSSDIYNGESYDARRELPGWTLAGFDDSSWSEVVTGLPRSAGGTADVTAKVRDAVRGNILSIGATNANFGDPAPGVVKTLQVRYRIGGDPLTAAAAENAALEVRGPEGSKIEVLGATYGPGSAQGSIETAVVQAHPGNPVRVRETLRPADIKEIRPGVWNFDLGQNFSGWARLKVRGPAGTAVTLRFAEMLNPDGTIYTKNLRGAKCTDTYVLEGSGDEVWEPRFTFHGFRYVEVSGYPGTPGKDAIEGIAIDSSAPLAGEFSCSDPRLHKLWRNIVWGQRSNYLEIPTDCPQRDERLGWTGDAQVFIGTGAYAMDVSAFFTAWLRTLHDSQREDGGHVDFSPKSTGVSAGWGDAGVICPWTVWQVYGDRRIVETYLDGMIRWIDYLERNSKDLIRPAEGYGDWLNVGAEMPKDVIATAYFAYSTRLVADMAVAVGRVEDAKRLQDLAGRIRAAFNKAFVGPDGKIRGDTQTTYLMALAFDLLPQERRKAAADLLVQRIQERDGHLSTGFLGVNLLLPTLTRFGRVDLAYRLLQNETYPSWLYSVKHGATTIWERWDGWTQEKGFQDPGMNSFNHYAYGSCGEWMFSTLAGIDRLVPGFKKILIRPRPGHGIASASATYDSIHGKIASAWKLEGGDLELRVTVPANTVAVVHVPAKDAGNVTEGGKPAGGSEGVQFLRMEEGCAVYRVGSGTYAFRSKGVE